MTSHLAQRVAMPSRPSLARAACTLWLATFGAGGAALAAERVGRAAEKPLDLTVRREAGAWAGVRDKAPLPEQKPAALALRERERERERAGGPPHQPYGAGYEARVMRGGANASPGPVRAGAGPAPAAPAMPAAPSPAGSRGHR